MSIATDAAIKIAQLLEAKNAITMPRASNTIKIIKVGFVCELIHLEIDAQILLINNWAETELSARKV